MSIFGKLSFFGPVKNDLKNRGLFRGLKKASFGGFLEIPPEIGQK
jgi:hypothetical protein